jgi:SRSO17 transposase
MIEAACRAEQHRDELMGRLGRVFARREPFLQARKYVQGLIKDLPRKNGWALAEDAGDATPDKMQRLLNHASWDEHAAMGIVRDTVMEHLADPTDPYPVAVLDESGQEKKGNRTFAVKRQYVGCAGRVSNAINVVYCTYATNRGHALIGARIYAPKEWASKLATDQNPTADTGPVIVQHASGAPATPQAPTETDPEPVPDPESPPELEFKTKPHLAIDLLRDLQTAGKLPPWLTGDSVYGRDRGLRTYCEDQNVGYVLGVPCSFPVQLNKQLKIRADHALKRFPPTSWIRDSCGPGSKGDRLYAWAWIGTASPRHHLLIRRNLSNPKDQAYFYCYIPEPHPQTLRLLVRIAGRRWPVEEDFQTGKDQFGLDHSQVRCYRSLIRHLTLTMIALAICALTASAMRQKTSTLPPPPTDRDQEPPDDPGLVPLSVAETRRLLNLFTPKPESKEHHMYWDWWKRRHQARARWFHQRTRLRHERPFP